MLKSWVGERRRFFAVLAAGLIAGWVTGYWLWCVLAAVLGYLIWHLAQLKRLLDWVRLGATPHRAPDLTGAWEPVVRYIYRIQKRNRKRKARMRSLLGRFEQIAVALPDGTVVLRANNEIDWANQVADRLLGVRYPQDGGQRIENLVRNPEFRNYLKRGDYDEPLNIPSPVLDDVELSIRIIPFGDGERLLSARDISTFLRIQAMRRDFVANVSHELRTPLTVISGYLEALLEDERLDTEVRDALTSVRQQSSRMQHIVQDLLELSRLETESGELPETEVRMAGLVASLVAEAQHVAEASGHRLHVEADERLALKGAEKELGSLVTNLVHNALRHTPAGTAVTVKWHAGEFNTTVFRVDDNGQGIDPRHIPRLTERFYRVDSGRARETGGSGLGLSIARHIVQRHGGRLEIDSTPGHGSSFSCIFPPERTIRLPAPRRAQRG